MLNHSNSRQQKKLWFNSISKQSSTLLHSQPTVQKVIDKSRQKDADLIGNTRHLIRLISRGFDFHLIREQCQRHTQPATNCNLNRKRPKIVRRWPAKLCWSLCNLILTHVRMDYCTQRARTTFLRRFFVVYWKISIWQSPQQEEGKTFFNANLFLIFPTAISNRKLQTLTFEFDEWLDVRSLTDCCLSCCSLASFSFSPPFRFWCEFLMPFTVICISATYVFSVLALRNDKKELSLMSHQFDRQ